MNRAWLVVRYEIYALVSRRSFWLLLIGVPLVGFIIYGGAAYLNRPRGGAAETASPVEAGAPAGAAEKVEAPQASPLEAIGELFEPQKTTLPQGYIDQAGLLVDIPGWFALDANWLAYSDPAQAAADLHSGKISAYYIIPPRFMEEGKLLAFTAEYNPVATQANSSRLREVISLNLFGSDYDQMDMFYMPFTEVIEENLRERDAVRRDTSGFMDLLLPYAVTSMLMMSVMGSATLLLNGLASEKVNRTMETLLISISPRAVLMGKVIGLGLVGLLQAGLWGCAGFALLRLGGQTFSLPDEYMLSVGVLAWAALFYLLGYLLYAALMAGIGALVPGMREASQVTVVVSLPLMTPYLVLPALVSNPNSWLAVALSLFPLTAPTGMLMRMSISHVPLWQALLSAGMLALTCLLVTRLAARMFRAQTIMSGQKFGLKTIWKAIAG